MTLTIFAVENSDTYKYLVTQGWKQHGNVINGLATLTMTLKHVKAPAHDLQADPLTASKPIANFS